MEGLIMYYRTISSEYYCGVDVHSTRSHLCILDHAGKKLAKMNIQNNFDIFKYILTPYTPNVVVGCESTYTYYWLADGCRLAGIPFYLGHALYMKAIRGNKHKNDPLDSSRLEFRPTNYGTWLLINKRKRTILRDPEGEYAMDSDIDIENKCCMLRNNDVY